MAHLTPGLRYLASGVAYGSVPVIGVFALQHVLKWAFGTHIPTWMTIVTSLATFPVGVIIRLSLKEWKDRRGAATMGAQIVPKVTGKCLGNVDVLQMLQEASVSGYPSMCSLTRFLSDKLVDEFIGDHFEDMFVSHGPMFNLPFMYTDVFFTASPEHLKLILATDFPNYVKGTSDAHLTEMSSYFFVGERFQEVMSPVLGSGVFNSDGTKCIFHPFRSPTIGAPY